MQFLATHPSVTSQEIMLQYVLHLMDGALDLWLSWLCHRLEHCACSPFPGRASVESMHSCHEFLWAGSKIILIARQLNGVKSINGFESVFVFQIN